MKRAVDATAFTEAAANLRQFDAKIEATAEATIDEVAEAVLLNVRRRRARHHVTGKGERLVVIQASGSGADRAVRVHAAGRIALLIAGGTRPHVIRPIEADALRMPGTMRGFAGKVRHPGTPADPFVAKGVEDSMARIDTITDDAGAELVAELAHEIGGR